MKTLSRREVAELCGCQERDIPSSPSFSLTRYDPPGPVGAAYIKSTGPIDGIMGPGGSGKTIASFFKTIRFAIGSMPVCRDGVVRCRITVMRDNYRSLYRTTLRSWFRFFPPDFPQSVFTGGADRPAQHRLRLSTTRPVRGVVREVPVDVEADFFAVGDQNIEELLKSYETSIGYCNEADQLHFRVPQFLFSRTGRYPDLDSLPEGAKRPRIVCFDMNPPKPNHPLLKAALRGTFKEPTADPFGAPVADETPVEAALVGERSINFFQQPSGLSRDAENRRGKTYGEYLEDVRVMTEEDARRMVHGLPGYATDGKPIYARDFLRRQHVAAGPIPIIPGLPLHIGFDQDLSPAAILFQISSLGQVRVLKELYLGHGIGYGRFLQALIPILTQPPFRDLPPGVYTSDPAGFYGADKEGGELAWSEAVGAGLGRPLYPAQSNEPSIRWEAVRLRLRLSIDANTPGLIIDPDGCPLLIEGFEAEYKFPKHREGAATPFGDQAVKNDTSNVHDALQYGLLGVYGRAGVIAESAKAGRPGNVVSLRDRQPATRPGDFSVWDL